MTKIDHDFNSVSSFWYMQSTLRKPEVSNMRKALSMQYTVGLVFYYGVSIAGYWAYGSEVSEYLPNQLSGPRWVKVLINTAIFLQSIVSQHVSNANDDSTMKSGHSIPQSIHNLHLLTPLILRSCYCRIPVSNFLLPSYIFF